MHNFTPEDLVQYLYHETSLQKSADIRAALENDWSLREMFEAIEAAHNELEPVELSPREEAVNKILQYAKKSMGELHPH